MKILSEKPSLEIKCTVEREITVLPVPGRAIMPSLKDRIGATFGMQFDGLTVIDVVENAPAFMSGMEKNDLVVDIDGKSTRYMPLKKAVSLLRDTKNDSIILKIRRELSIWRTV